MHPAIERPSWSPLLIEVLLHYYYSPSIFPRRSLAVRQAEQYFMKYDFTRQAPDFTHYELTDKGREWCERLQVAAYSIAKRLHKPKRRKHPGLGESPVETIRRSMPNWATGPRGVETGDYGSGGNSNPYGIKFLIGQPDGSFRRIHDFEPFLFTHATGRASSKAFAKGGWIDPTKGESPKTYRTFMTDFVRQAALGFGVPYDFKAAELERARVAAFDVAYARFQKLGDKLKTERRLSSRNWKHIFDIVFARTRKLEEQQLVIAIYDALYHAPDSRFEALRKIALETLPDRPPAPYKK